MIQRIKKYIHIKFPSTIAQYERFRNFGNIFKDTEKIFSSIYKLNRWKDENSVSGDGSNLLATEELRKKLPEIIKLLNIKSLLDAPCGDYYWMGKTNILLDKYIGVDVVPELVESNQRKFGDNARKFLKLDVMVDQLPNAEMILCRDLLVHFSYKDIIRTLINFKKSGAIYLLTTTFVNISRNVNGVTGGWRPINLQKSPFNFPAPEILIHENDIDEYARSFGKHLGLWTMKDIPF